MKILSEGRHPSRYFTSRDNGNWNCLDFFIVCVGFVELTPLVVFVEMFPVVILRLLRMLRVFRLAKALPRLRAIVEVRCCRCCWVSISQPTRRCGKATTTATPPLNKCSD